MCSEVNIPKLCLYPNAFKASQRTTYALHVENAPAPFGFKLILAFRLQRNWDKRSYKAYVRKQQREMTKQPKTSMIIMNLFLKPLDHIKYH